MRIGNNPNRRVPVTGYSPMIMSAICHLPNMEGYHAHRFDVVKACLESMRANCGYGRAETLIWDNGSCGEFRHWLIEIYKPDHVVLTTNIGKASARAGILRMLPPHTMVNISDDDMWYYPDWFKRSMEVYDDFPNVGQVSGYPVRTQFRWGNRRTLLWAKEHAELEYGKFIPESWDRDFCSSIGRDYEFQKQYTVNDYDPRITYRGTQAYAVAHHCQFICEAGKIAPFAVWDQDGTSDEKPFDTAIDEAGLLRLTTIHRHARHMGNVMDEDLLEKYHGLHQEVMAHA